MSRSSVCSSARTSPTSNRRTAPGRRSRQACVLYGAAEYSRDLDLAVLATPGAMPTLRAALGALNATVIAVPSFDERYLDRGHAVHFSTPDGSTSPLRVDVMSRMRGVDEFPALWERRTTIALPTGDDDAEVLVDVMALEDLVAAKKTQRDKDWPMLHRLVDASYVAAREVSKTTATALLLLLENLLSRSWCLRDRLRQCDLHRRYTKFLEQCIEHREVARLQRRARIPRRSRTPRHRKTPRACAPPIRQRCLRRRPVSRSTCQRAAPHQAGPALTATSLVCCRRRFGSPTSRAAWTVCAWMRESCTPPTGHSPLRS